MSERERVREMRKRKLKRAVIMGAIAVLLVRKHRARRRNKRNEDME